MSDLELAIYTNVMSMGYMLLLLSMILEFWVIKQIYTHLAQHSRYIYKNIFFFRFILA